MSRVCVSILIVGWILGSTGRVIAGEGSSPPAFASGSPESGAFIENRGQWDGPSLFLARSAGATVRLEADGFSAVLPEAPAGSGRASRPIVGLRYEGARTDGRPEGEDALPGAVRYFRGRGRSSRGIAAARFASVVYPELYPGIAVRVRMAAGSAGAAPLEYDILAEPGADLGLVVIATEGIDGIRIDADGSLVLETPAGEVRHHPPVAWTEPASGERAPTPSRFRLLDGCRYGLEAPEWDGSSPLVIDPVVAWSRFLGGESDDFLFDVQVRESDGTVIVAGSTHSLSFPELEGAEVAGERSGGLDAFVVSFDASTGELRDAAVLAGGGDDEAWSIAVGPGGEVTIAGFTESPDFPVTSGGEPPWGPNAFVARLSPDLSELEYSRLLGGSGEDRAANVALGEGGSVWVLGFTDSWDFPVTAGAFQGTRPGGRYDLFVTRLRPDDGVPDEEQIAYSTYLGGSGAEPLDYGTTYNHLFELGLAADAGGRVCIAGRTDSRDFPTSPGARDRSYGDGFSRAFVCVLDSGAEGLLYSTYLGGLSDGSAATDIAFAPSGDVWITGWTFVASFPVTPDAHDSQFDSNDSGWANGILACIRPDDSIDPADQLVYSTFLSPSGGAIRCALGPDETVMVVGAIRGSHLSASPGAPGATFSGEVDGFLTVLDPSRHPKDQHLFSTYIGGGADERPLGLAVDSSGRACVVGRTSSSQMQGVDGQSNGGQDGFIAVLDLRIPTAAFTADGPHEATVALDAAPSSTPAGTAIQSYRWDFGDGSTAEGPASTHAFPPGRFPVALTVTNDLGLESTRSQAVTVPCPPGDVAPWTGADVGSPIFPGSSRRVGDDILLCAGGVGLVASSDEVHSVHRDVAGDFVLTARIAEVSRWNSQAGLGLMARAGLDAGAPYAAIVVEKLTGARQRLRYREAAGANARSLPGPATEIPLWLRLERSGDLFIARSSSDGAVWVEVERQEIPGMPESLLVGLVAYGKDSGDATKAFVPLEARVSDLAVEGSEGPGEPRFIRADANADGQVDISDAVFVLNWLFLGGESPGCRAAADSNGDAGVDISDPTYLLNHLFLGGPAPEAPYPECGVSELEGDAALGCEAPPPGCA